jgi:hypothetical protein
MVRRKPNSTMHATSVIKKKRTDESLMKMTNSLNDTGRVKCRLGIVQTMTP